MPSAVGRVGARWAVPVHWGTFWPVALSRITPARHTTLFTTPGARFADALRANAPDVTPVSLGTANGSVSSEPVFTRPG